MYRVLVLIWPFLWEMLIGDKPLKKAIFTHKKQILIILLICGSIVLNGFLLPRLVMISKDYVELQRDYQAVLAKQDGSPENRKRFDELSNAAINYKQENAELKNKIQDLILNQCYSDQVPKEANRHNKTEGVVRVETEKKPTEVIKSTKDRREDLKKFFDTLKNEDDHS